MSISDDGLGLVESDVDGGGLGLASVSERLARLGGTLSVTSNEDSGVTVQASVPA